MDPVETLERPYLEHYEGLYLEPMGTKTKPDFVNHVRLPVDKRPTHTLSCLFIVHCKHLLLCHFRCPPSMHVKSIVRCADDRLSVQFSLCGIMDKKCYYREKRRETEFREIIAFLFDYASICSVYYTGHVTR